MFVESLLYPPTEKKNEHHPTYDDYHIQQGQSSIEINYQQILGRSSATRPLVNKGIVITHS